MNTRAFSLVLAAMTLAGCANYSGLDTQGQRLDANTLHTGKSLSGVTLSSAAWPAADWWKSLGDPQLDGLIQEALQNSPDMQVADARAHQAEAAAYAANAARMPTLDASAGVSRSRLAKDQDPRGQGDAYSTVRNIGASFNYNFDLWGGQRAAWEAALGEARAAEVDQQAARLTLAANVAKAYSDLGQAHIVRDLAVDDLKRTRQMLDLSKRRLSSGIDSEYQFQQTESLEASSQSQLIDAEKQLQSAKIASRRIARQRPGPWRRVGPPSGAQTQRRGRARGAACRVARPSPGPGCRTLARRGREQEHRCQQDPLLPQPQPERECRCRVVAGRCDVRFGQPLLQHCADDFAADL